MAAAVTAPSVLADLFPSGSGMAGMKAEEQNGAMLPEQVALPARVSKVEVHVLLAVPAGPLQTLPSARPSELKFGALNDPEYQLRQPIPLAVTTEGSNVVVCWAEADEFGVGDTLGAALDDFGASVRELYRSLHESKQLGPDLENIKRILGEYIALRSR